MALSPRDVQLIDALEALPVKPFESRVWRVVREGRDPRLCSAAGNRWDDGTFEVLYTATARDGAIAEMYFHLKRGQPVFPSKIRYALHELQVHVDGLLDLSELDDLADLGLDVARFGQLCYQDRKGEYPRCQEIAEVANFVGSPEPGDVAAILVPNARWACSNLVVFCGYAGPAAVAEVQNHGVVDWREWDLARNTSRA
ncbi:MAG: RES family NAD+ phosphorylase [Alphaproteobacteria bacterium]